MLMTVMTVSEIFFHIGSPEEEEGHLFSVN